MDANHEQTVTTPTKKLPKNFCVIQETKSENVSTEHVDFQLARKKWRDMEEQTINKMILPSTKLPSIHGLEDFSSKSPHDDGDTPERNICLSLEKEENFKKERGVFKMSKSTDCAPSQNYPRSISTPLMPSFIITSSPTKEPFKHEVSANSVIILEPGSDLSSHSQTGNEKVPAWSGNGNSENRSSDVIILETSNVISSGSEFSLSRVCEQSQEKMFLNNPFFKLRSKSTVSIVDEEIKMAKKREEELRKDRANLYGKDKFDTDKGGSNRMDSLAFSHSSDVILLETLNVIIRSASEFSLSRVCEQSQEKLSLNNPFFKLRSRSTVSIVDEEIKMAKQREEELRKDRANLYGKDKFDTDKGGSNGMDSLAFSHSVDVPMKC